MFLETNQDQLFKFEVKGPRKHYKFSMKLVDDLVPNSPYLSVKFKMTPYSTYIGLDEEKLVLTFLKPNKIVVPDRTNITIANKNTSITIYDTSDAIPKDVDAVSVSLGYIMGFGTLSTFLISFLLKIFFGGKFNLGWGLINFIQITAFIPLANMYFPGNIRGFVGMLKIVNTAGSGMPNLFYAFMDRSDFNMEPYNYRFEVMDIETTVFIEN